MTIRLARPDDAGALLAIYAPIVRDTAISFEVEPPTETEFRERLAATLEVRPWLVGDIGGALAGYAYAGAHRERAAYRWSVEPSVYVHEAHRRQGVARALYRALFAVLRAQGYYNAYAGITLPNAGSVKLHESLGFQPVGVYRNVGYKMDRWHDVVWLYLPLQDDHSGPVRPPLPLRELIGTGAWEEALRAGSQR